MSDDNNEITLQEVDKVLRQIEIKYSPLKVNAKKIPHGEMLAVLSDEFDTLGLPCIDLSGSKDDILEQVISSTRELVQLHRKTLSQLQYADIQIRSRETKNAELRKQLEHSAKVFANLEKKYITLENGVKSKLKTEIMVLQKRDHFHRDEMQKLKQYISSKEAELNRVVSDLTRQNHRMKQTFGQNLGRFIASDDVMSILLNKYKKNENVYLETIKTLQQKNTQLSSEVFHLKEELYHGQQPVSENQPLPSEDATNET